MRIRIALVLVISLFVFVACDQTPATTETHDMSDMDMDSTEEAEDMSDMDMSGSDIGAVSGAYLRVSNGTDADVTLLSVSAEGVGVAEIHQSVMENDVMRMEYMAEGLLIPAGESIELSPGTYHVMLMQLDHDLIEGETIRLTLEFDNGTIIGLDAPIAFVNPEDDMSVENEGITVSLAWVRPTGLADDSEMDMDATEESSGD